MNRRVNRSWESEIFILPYSIVPIEKPERCKYPNVSGIRDLCYCGEGI
jgi:hypothetical protein